MRLDLIRLMLLRRKQPDFFEDRREDGLVPTREEWLRALFATRIDFSHRGNLYAYAPARTHTPLASRYLAGKIGRLRLVRENEPPDRGLDETEREQWKAVEFILDPTAHEDGQKIALALDSTVGQPLALMRALAKDINERSPPSPYVMEANGIADPDTFWQFVEENDKEITSVTFELVPPNMFGIRDELDKEMTELREKEKARKVKLTIQNDDGLELKTNRVKTTANYTAEGGGNISARTKKGKTYNSKRKTKAAIIPDNEMLEEDQPSRFRRIIRAVFGQ